MAPLSTVQQSSMPKPDIGRKTRCFDPVRGTRRSIAMRFGVKKIEWCSYFRDCKALQLVTSLTHVSGAIVSRPCSPEGACGAVKVTWF